MFIIRWITHQFNQADDDAFVITGLIFTTGLNPLLRYIFHQGEKLFFWKGKDIVSKRPNEAKRSVVIDYEIIFFSVYLISLMILVKP